MKNLSARLGFWSSLVSIASFVVFTACFLAIFFVNAPFSWTNLEDFSLYEANSFTLFKYIAMASMIVFACSFVVLTLCTEDTVSPEKRPLLRISSFFALAFCVTICINYFVQVTATRLQLQNGLTDGLAQFTQSFNISAINAINMLGWTLFYPLSTFFLAFLFDHHKIEKTIKWFCFANALMMMVGLTGYVANHFLTLALSMNLGLGLTTLGMTIPMAIRFKKHIA